MSHFISLSLIINFFNSSLFKGSNLLRIMDCSSCNVTKLSEEFPDVTLTTDCNHAALHCFRVSYILMMS